MCWNHLGEASWWGSSWSWPWGKRHLEALDRWALCSLELKRERTADQNRPRALCGLHREKGLEPQQPWPGVA